MKHKADYSTTIIYKITCNDPNITDKYVGHTTDLVRRRQGHKNNTYNKNSAYYNLKLYKFIREHGGWDNWKMEIIAHYNCNNLNEAKQKEQAHYTELKASLNSIEPLKLTETAKECKKSLCDVKTTSKFHCEVCDITCGRPADWRRHISTIKHTQAQNIAPKIPLKFICSDCHYECCKKSMIDRHKLSTRHKNRVKSNMTDSAIKSSSEFITDVANPSSQNEYSQNTSVTPKNPPIYYMTIISQLLNQNNELNNFIIKQANENKNFIIEQAAEHKKDTLDILNKVIETVKHTNNNTINDRT